MAYYFWNINSLTLYHPLHYADHEELSMPFFGLYTKNSRILKAIRAVKEYIEIDFFGEWKIVPVYQYACYISTYRLDAAGQHEIYKQRPARETWIEQVKGQDMP